MTDQPAPDHVAPILLPDGSRYYLVPWRARPGFVCVPVPGHGFVERPARGGRAWWDRRRAALRAWWLTVLRRCRP